VHAATYGIVERSVK